MQEPQIFNRENAKYTSHITDVDGLTLGVEKLSALGWIEPGLTGTAIVLEASVNTLGKGILVWCIGPREIRASIARRLGIMSLIGSASDSGLLLSAG